MQPPAARSGARSSAHTTTTTTNKRQDRTASPPRRSHTTDDDAKVDERSPTHSDPNGATAEGEGHDNNAPFARLTGTQDARAIDLLRVITTASLPRTERLTPKLAKALSQWGRHVSVAHAGLGSNTLPGPAAVVAWAKRLDAHSAGPRIGQLLVRPLLRTNAPWDLAPVWAEITAKELHDAGAFAEGGVDEGPLNQSIRDTLEQLRGLKDLRHTVSISAGSAHLLPQVDTSIATASEALIVARTTLADAKETNAACARIQMSLPPAPTAATAATTSFLARLNHLNAGTGGAATLSDPDVDSILAQARATSGTPSFTAALSRIGGRATIDVSEDAYDMETKDADAPPPGRATVQRDEPQSRRTAVRPAANQQQQQQQQQPGDARTPPQQRSGLAIGHGYSSAADPTAHYAGRGLRVCDDARDWEAERTAPTSWGAPYADVQSRVGPAPHGHASDQGMPFEPTTIHTDDFVYAGEEVDAMGGKTLCGLNGLQSTRIRPSKGAPSRRTQHELATHGATYYQAAIGNSEALRLTDEVAPAGFLARRYTMSSAQTILNDIVQNTQQGTGRLSVSQRLQQLQDQLDGALPHLRLSTVIINKDSIVTLLSRGKL